MTIYNREDYKTALPQLEKSMNNKIQDTFNHVFDVEEIPLTFNNCSSGSYSCCYRIGNIVFLAFNINITTAAASYDYITGMPPAIHLWACTGNPTGSVNTTRWVVTTLGTLRTDNVTVTGWQNGSVVYICE